MFFIAPFFLKSWSRVHLLHLHYEEPATVDPGNCRHRRHGGWLKSPKRGHHDDIGFEIADPICILYNVCALNVSVTPRTPCPRDPVCCSSHIVSFHSKSDA